MCIAVFEKMNKILASDMCICLIFWEFERLIKCTISIGQTSCDITMLIKEKKKRKLQKTGYTVIDC